MASCTDLHKLSTTNDNRPILKATPVPIFSSKKFVEPLTRLKNRANIFRRKNYSSQIDISNPRTSLVADHMIPSFSNSNLHLKRSNSMICSQQPQQQPQFPLVSSKQRNSLCLQPTNNENNEHYRLFKSSSTRFWKKKMSHIIEQDSFPSDNDDEHQQENVLIEKKISISTMTGKSLNNLHECLSSSTSSSSTTSEDKCIQTTFEHHQSSTSLSSNSTSIQTDSLENKPQINQCQLKSHDKWSHVQTCIYWVNYLGSTSIQMSPENPSILPTYAIKRLKQTTQYARILPIIGLGISSDGVEFLKHSKERSVICFHDIKSIHCACQDRDLRYFAYVTREQRLINDSNSSLSNDDYHNYCHVFVVKNEQMSTEILLKFAQAFETAYQQHQITNVNSSSIDERRVFI